MFLKTKKYNVEKVQKKIINKKVFLLKNKIFFEKAVLWEKI